MKRIIMGLLVLSLTLVGCGSSDLLAYQEALEETQSAKSGVVDLEMAFQLSFNEEGLTDEERLELSYFEDIRIENHSVYDVRGDVYRSIQDSYYKYGGTGIDLQVIVEGEEVVMKIPLIEKYVRLIMNEEGDLEAQDNVTVKIIDKWQEILMEEDVFSGERAYVTTDRGQLKTLTYHMHIGEQQYGEMKQVLIDELLEGQLIQSLNIEAYLPEDSQLKEEDLAQQALILLDHMVLLDFSGQAYVDYDGRLIQQEMIVELVDPEAQAGSLEKMTLNYNILYDQLNEVVDLDLPDFDQLEYETMTEDLDWESVFPSNLFGE